MHIRGIVKTMYFLTLKYDMNSGMPTAIIIYHKQGLFRMSHTAGIYYLYLWLLCNEQNVIDCTNLLYLYSIFYERLKFIIPSCIIFATYYSRIPKIYKYSISYFGPTVCIPILINLLLCFILFIFNNFMANEKSSNTKMVLHYSTVLEE